MNFSFASSYFLLLLLLLPCFFWCKASVQTYYFAKLSWIDKEQRIFMWTLWLKLVIFALMVFALALPFVYDEASNHHKKGRDLVLAIDASGSMAQSGFDSKDRLQNKFSSTILLSKDFIAQRFDDNMGVVLFGTFAYTASPLTYDLEALSYLLDMTTVGIAGESTAIGDAIMQGIRTLSYGEASSKVIILLSDGYHNAGAISPKEATQKAKAKGIKIYTIGIGKKSDYDVTLLEHIAKESGAKSYHALKSSDLRKVYAQIEALEPSALRSENYLNQRLLVFYPLALLVLLLALWTIMGFRREK